MTEDNARPRQRTRRRGSAPEGPPPAPAAQTAPIPGPAPKPEGQRRRRPHRDQGERAMRDLAGSGRSQLGVDRALRGRDLNRPTDDDLAEAERDVVIVRRRWSPTQGGQPPP